MDTKKSAENDRGEQQDPRANLGKQLVGGEGELGTLIRATENLGKGVICHSCHEPMPEAARAFANLSRILREQHEFIQAEHSMLSRATELLVATVALLSPDGETSPIMLSRWQLVMGLRPRDSGLLLEEITKFMLGQQAERSQKQ